MAPPPKHVLRLRRTDNKSAHFLVHVAQEGRNELDLKLIGTDKSELYVVSLTAADTKSYQDRNFNGSEEDFQTLLKFSFLHYRSDAILPASLQGVETVAAINGPTASITIRKNVDGITQRLGTIHLQENTSHTEIDTFDWVEAATAEADELRSQLDGLQISVESQKNSIAKLTTELDMLVRAKKAHEDDLLSKFAALLNAKKLKIRDQQRLLNGAQIDPVAATEVSNARLSRTTRKAGASRSGKRKAKATPSRALDGEQEESEEAIAEEDHTMNGSEEDTSRHDQVTPEPDHADAATESEDEEVPKPAAAARRSQNTQERRAERW
ncbi:hypothetical protein CB0940_02626 [Cercospora beticola]|uniref:Mitotic apparatus protein p62 n=1 Tax=Cercospora beticola TaxID=122368 RepID=A0A2G5I4N9_CERBT|nr:hypothetical protein CB0940_02626 [Cercospora beticola]PIA99453.1 hypothetical protein CB0940_02626 [Cercospora beticola]WPA99772.1 hypothetical protein RHO25_004391 [Cercospora beticola]